MRQGAAIVAAVPRSAYGVGDQGYEECRFDPRDHIEPDPPRLREKPSHLEP